MMLEILPMVAGIWALGSLAEKRGDSSVKWTVIAAVACVLTFTVVPTPFLRLLLALSAVFVAIMVVTNSRGLPR